MAKHIEEMFWKTSTPWCVRCGYGCLVSNRRNSELLLASRTKCNSKHDSMSLNRELDTILFSGCTFSACFWVFFCSFTIISVSLSLLREITKPLPSNLSLIFKAEITVRQSSFREQEEEHGFENKLVLDARME